VDSLTKKRLENAIVTGEYGELKRILQSVDPNDASFQDEELPLVLALKRGSPAKVHIVLESGADPNARGVALEFLLIPVYVESFTVPLRIPRALPGNKDLGGIDEEIFPFDPSHGPTVGDVGGGNGGTNLSPRDPFRMRFSGERSLGTSSPRRGRKAPTLRTRQGSRPWSFLPLVFPRTRVLVEMRPTGELCELKRSKALWALDFSRRSLRLVLEFFSLDIWASRSEERF